MDLQKEILKLSVAERIIIVENIWDSIAEENNIGELTPQQKKELDSRLKKLHAGETKLSSWDDVKKRLEAML